MTLKISTATETVYRL